MEKLPIYKQQLGIHIALVSISSAVLLFMFSEGLTSWSDWIFSCVFSSAMFGGILQLVNRNKSFFRFDETHIEWLFLEDEET